MTVNSSMPAPRVTPDLVDEAAVWMTLLHSSARSKQTEAGFRRWLSTSAAHAQAFEKVSRAHELTAALPRGPFPRVSRWERAGYRDGFRKAALIAAVLAVVVIGALFVASDRAIETRIGEQRTLVLDDGSQVYLNTDTRLEVRYTPERRVIDLENGEAMFDVAKVAHRPFVVQAAGREITALGTSFVVRRDAQTVAVTLVEGRVGISSQRGSALVLSPGERVVFARNADSAKKDKPALEKLTAWRQGQVDLDEMPLARAVAEINRYSTTRLAVGSSVDPNISITGVFRLGAAKSFALAVADEYHLAVREDGGTIWLDAPVRAAPNSR